MSGIGNAPTEYAHQEQFITAGNPLILPGAFLKWYELRRDDDPIPRDLAADARSILTQEVSDGGLVFDHGVGFVVLHYSPPLIYLIVGSWRQNLEFWEALYLRDLRACEGFKRVEPGVNAPTPCVWEMAPVWHERRAWTRFLSSPRDHSAKRSRVNDYLSGTV